MATNKNAVKVFVRTKPTSNFAQDMINIMDDNKSINVKLGKRKEGGYVNNQQESWGFSFDEVMNNMSQDEVYERCGAPVTQSVLDGYNGTIMCYGQTGAGKTFTMTGTTENYRHRGIIPRAIAHVFREIKSRTDSAITVRVSYVELYNESMYDLLSLSGTAESNKENKDGNAAEVQGSELKIIEDSSGNTNIMGLTHQIANSEEEALHLLFEGETNRSIAEHQLNKSSTRSHCIFSLHLDIRSRVESSEKITLSKLNLVDLAGSERLKKTQSEGAIMKEAMYINKSLTFLEQVIIALSDKHRDHIPYRQCKLTNILKDSLGGNCKTHMVANIWAEAQSIEETIATLKFATRMMRVSNEPVINVTYDPAMLVKKYEREIKELKAELAMHDTLTNKSHVQYETYTETQKNDLNASLRKYLAEEIDDIEIINLRQIKEMLVQLRIIFKDMERETELKTKQKFVREKPPEVDIEQAHTAQGEDEGVGEAEGGGFAVGLAPSTRNGTPKGSRLKPAPKVPFSRSKSHTKLLATNPSPSPPPSLAPSPSPSPIPPPTASGERTGGGLGGGQVSGGTLQSGQNGNGNGNGTNAAQNGTGGNGGASVAGVGEEKKGEKKGGGVPGSKQQGRSGRQSSSRAGDPPKSSEAGDNTKRNKHALSPSPTAMSMTTDQQQHQQQLQQDHSLPLPPSHPLSHSSDRPPATPLSHPSDDMRRASPSDFERSRPPQKEEEKRREEKRVAPADKNTAFQEFKGGVGGEVNQKMKENTELMKEKKKQLKSAGESVNAVKKEIDSLKVFAEQKRRERMQKPEFQVEGEGEGDETEIIDEEEFRAITSMRDAKRAYRDAYETLKAVQVEVDTVTRMAEQCRQKLISDFEVWYGNSFVVPQEEKRAPLLPSLPATSEDVLDYQEKFDKMGLEKVVQVDPEAAAFYNASKQIKKKELLLLSSKNKPSSSSPSKSSPQSNGKKGSPSKWV